MNFSEWLLDEGRRGHKPHPDQRTLFDRGDFVPPKKALPRPVKKKVASIAHTDIDRWLKSVDGLAKDLSALKNAKSKAKEKMDQVGKPTKPDEDKSIEKEKDNEKSGLERKTPERSRSEADREILPLRSKSKPKPPKPDQFKRTDAEDSTDVKRVIEDQPVPRKSKVAKRINSKENME